MKVVVASAIISAAVVFSAVMMSGNINFKKQNILETDNGHVNLGKVYSERSLVDVVLRFSDDKTVVFTARGLSSGSYMDGVDEKIQTVLDNYNKDKPDAKKLTKETLAFKVPVTLTVQTYMEYRSENFPSYELTLNKKEITIDKDTVVYKAISDELTKLVMSDDRLLKKTYFIKSPQ